MTDTYFRLPTRRSLEMALIRPDLVHRLVPASSAPKGAGGMHGWAPEVIDAVGKPGSDPGPLPAGLLHPDRQQPRRRASVTAANVRQAG
jgi:hypothetical protein